MTGLIQGTDAVLSFYKNGFIPFVCTENIDIQITGDKLPIRTVKDGHWRKFTYQNQTFIITLSGLMKFDAVNFTGWDIIDNQLNFFNVNFRLSYTDDLGEIKSFQGYAMVESTTVKATPIDVVKGEFQLQGTGALMYFDGLVPCDTEITSITITGQTAGDGIAHIAYTYSGAVAQIKYRVDGTGDYIYRSVGSFEIPGLAIGDHDIEIIPVCLNSYEGIGMDQAFSMTAGLTCALDITSIGVSVTGSTATVTVNFGSSPTGASMKYRINGSAYVNYVGSLTNPTAFLLRFLSVGSYTIDIVPVCSNGVAGTGNSQSFNVAASGGTPLINVQSNFVPSTGSSLQVYKNGTLQDNFTTSQTGSFTSNSGDTILVYLSVAQTARDINLVVTDNDTSTQIYNVSHITTDGSTYTLTFSFSATASSYLIHGIISP